MTGLPRVSVLMPVRDADNYLSHAVTSVLTQTFTDLELLVVDDHSASDPAETLGHVDDSRLRVIANEGPAGFSHALNHGLKAVTGKYVARMDADDVSLPHRIERQVAFLESNPSVDIVGAAIAFLDPTGEVRLDPGMRPLLSGHVRWAMRFYCCLAHPTVVARGQRLLDLGGYNAEMYPAEDHELWLRAVDAGYNLANIPDVLLHYRLNPSGMSHTSAARQEIVSTDLAHQALQRAVAGADLDVTTVRAVRDPASILGAKEDIGAVFRRAADLLADSIEVAIEEGATPPELEQIRLHARDLMRRLFWRASTGSPGLALRFPRSPVISRRAVAADSVRALSRRVVSRAKRRTRS